MTVGEDEVEIKDRVYVESHGQAVCFLFKYFLGFNLSFSVFI